MKRIVALLASNVLYGKERANIEVYHIVKDHLGVAPEVIISSRANPAMLAALEGFQTHRVRVPERHSRHLPLLTYALQYVAANLRLILLLLRLRPQLLLMCSETTFYNFYLALLTYRGKILYRVGDCPAFTRLSFRRYNEHVWRHYVLRRVTRCVFNAQFVRREMEQAGRDTTHDKVIYNYPPARKPGDGSERARYGTPDPSAVTFGYIGQLIEIKGVHHFIECALQILRDHPDSTFYIAGSLRYDPAYSARLQAMVPEVYSHRIVFLGEINDLATFFEQVDVLCVPSIKQEPLANVLTEAKLFARPSVIYPSGGMPELVHDGHDGYICSASTAPALLEGMRHYVGNKPLARRHGQAARQSMQTMHIGREDFVARWVEVLRGVGV